MTRTKTTGERSLSGIKRGRATDWAKEWVNKRTTFQTCFFFKKFASYIPTHGENMWNIGCMMVKISAHRPITQWGIEWLIDDIVNNGLKRLVWWFWVGASDTVHNVWDEIQTWPYQERTIISACLQTTQQLFKQLNKYSKFWNIFSTTRCYNDTPTT